MPTIIALDVSLSMQRLIPGRSEDNALTYYQLAAKGINQFLEHLSNNSKLEFVSYATFSNELEVRVDFTRDYDQIRQAVKKQVHFDSSCIETLLKGANDILSSTWGTQNPCQILVFTDCGLGFGPKSLPFTIRNIASQKPGTRLPWLDGLYCTKINFICLGVNSDYYFTKAVQVYQRFIDISGLNAFLLLPKSNESSSSHMPEETKSGSRKSELGRATMHEMIERLCETCYKPFEVTLKCGGYFRMECAILIWPPPAQHYMDVTSDIKQSITLSNTISVCGYISLSDVGSPASLSRHLIVPKIEKERHKRSDKNKVVKASSPSTFNEYEKLENEIRSFYYKVDGDGEEENHKTTVHSDPQKESICVLLHGALKIENMAAVVLLAENWFGFIYTYADSKKKSNLLLNILLPGPNVIPWLGDLRMFGMADDLLMGENASFPVKSEKRSYSQNFVIWIKQSSLQSDIQKVLRHAKKIPEKTQNFYKELNRLRRAALSIGFVELLEVLATIFEKEISSLPSTANPECALQLKHSAMELRKTANRDLKNAINPLSGDLNS